ncbi:MAG: hypothetical protein E7069_06620 [Bacteroidales bacterium]|nr:hypothetical protein [Bacteroidales bacterium]
MSNIKVKNYIALLFAVLSLCGCRQSTEERMLRVALEQAGTNRTELECVLNHYAKDSLKLEAAKFLIRNMPAHYSYADSAIERYYTIATQILQSELTPIQQRDTLLALSKKSFAYATANKTSDIKIMSAQYLIKNIDDAFEQWQQPWARHLSFDEFCEWILPYKAVEFQSFDAWRDTMRMAFADTIARIIPDDEEYNTIPKTLSAVRNRILSKVKPYGVYTEIGHTLLSASTISRLTFGQCHDYVLLGVLAYRSVGLPAIIDGTPMWGRYRSGHTWYVTLSHRGEQLTSEWDISSVPGQAFFPYERIPKVYRSTYAMNLQRLKYKNGSVLKYSFPICQIDVTDKYFSTSDIGIFIAPSTKLVEPYAYISVFNGHDIEWSVVDYGEVKNGKAYFKKIGRNILYIAQGFDGQNLVPISQPFIVHQDGCVEYIVCDTIQTRPLDIRRKYYQSRNVAEMRHRLLGGKIQGANRLDFADAETLFVINNVYVNDPQEIQCNKAYRYYRYLSANDCYGSIAELAFYDSDTTKLEGAPIACEAATVNVTAKAFDNDYLTNFETQNKNNNWVGIKLSKPQEISFVRIIPRSDDNDIRVGDTYELRYFNGRVWVALEQQVAKTNVLRYDNVPTNALYWVRDLTRGWDERPFIIRNDSIVEWR